MFTVGQLARQIGGVVIGDEGCQITGFAPAEKASEGEITFLAFPKYLPAILDSGASCVIVSTEIRELKKAQIVVSNPYFAFAQVVQLFQGSRLPPPGISPKAEIAASARIGREPSIGPFVFIDEEAVLGDRVILFPGVFVGRNAEIGNDTLIYSHVSIRDGTSIGNRVIIHSGAVIGSDGFGFVTVKGKHEKIPQVGIAVIEDDVSIGANVTIDRATLGETRIKKGTKIDALVHFGHNVIVGEHGLFAAQTGVSGSVKIGDYATIGGQTGFSGHLQVGNHVKMAGRTGVTRDIEDNMTIAGFPAVSHLEWKRTVVLISQLSKMQKQIRSMERKISDLEERLRKH